MADVKGALFQWRNDEHDGGCYGEGISRPRHGARVRNYKVIVYPKGARPITWYTRAESKAAAIKYAYARWPGSVVEVA
jgi:hypothetical protein